MKSLQEYVSIKSGKQLFEKMLHTSKTANLRKDEVDIDIPFIDLAEEKYEKNNIVGTITVPNKKYYVYLDAYRWKRPHIDSSVDALCQIATFWSDYEGFNPDKDILFSADTLKEIIEWVMKKFNMYIPKSDDDEEREKFNESYELAEKKLARNKFILDNEEFLFNAYFGYDALDEYDEVSEKNFRDALSNYIYF
jgi:hypothetical protein